MATTVRPMTPDDLPAVVRIHQIAFKGFFLDRMGPSFLAAYYGSVLAYEKSIALVSESENGALTGFVAGFIDPDAFYLHYRKGRIRLIPIIVAALLKNPKLIAEIVRNSARVQGHQGGKEQTAELASIGASEQGSGVGGELTRGFCSQAFAQGALAVTLSTDESGNESVRQFYERRGFKATHTEQRGNRVLCHYRLERPAAVSA